MDLSDILKFIVPLSFLAIWALTALFNRDAKPLPGRVQGPANPYAPRQAVAPSQFRPTPPERPQPTIRWAGQGNPPGMPRAGGNDDDIVILESTRQARPVNQGKGVAPARRSRAKPAPAAKPAQAAPPKLGSSGISQTVNQQLSTSMPIAPLATLHGTTVVKAVASDTRVTEGSDIALTRLVAIRAAMTDPVRLREAILINEMLRPPLGLRYKRGRR